MHKTTHTFTDLKTESRKVQLAGEK